MENIQNPQNPKAQTPSEPLKHKRVPPKIWMSALVGVVLFVGYLGVASTFDIWPFGEAEPRKQKDKLAGSQIYRNEEYGFEFKLPETWKGYLIATDKWEGYTSSSKGDVIAEQGPMISIRHPQWTSQSPRQDIPIMIFTTNQWSLLLQDKFNVSAAPVPPSELARNSIFVFALPARYNYAFPAGWEEVGKILKEGPLTTFEPNWQTYRNEEFGFEFKYPTYSGDNELVVEENDRNTIFREKWGSPAKIVVEILGNPKFESPRTFLSRTSDSFRDPGLSETDLTVGGKSALLLKHPDLSGNTYYIQSSNYFMEVFIDLGQNTNQQIFSTFKFIEQEIDTSTYRNQKYGFEIKYAKNLPEYPAEELCINEGKVGALSYTVEILRGCPPNLEPGVLNFKVVADVDILENIEGLINHIKFLESAYLNFSKQEFTLNDIKGYKVDSSCKNVEGMCYEIHAIILQKPSTDLIFELHGYPEIISNFKFIN